MTILLLIPFIVFICILIYISISSTTILEELQEQINPIASLNLTNYDISNIEQVYHPSYIDPNVQADGGFALPVFYIPKSYVYSPKAYIPNYIDSIYMSSLTGLSNVAQYYDVSYNDLSGNNPYNVHKNA
jgi:hypothetical protein